MKKSIRKSIKRQMMTAYQELRDKAKPVRLYGVENYTSPTHVSWDALDRRTKK